MYDVPNFFLVQFESSDWSRIIENIRSLSLGEGQFGEVYNGKLISNQENNNGLSKQSLHHRDITPVSMTHWFHVYIYRIF